MIGTERALRTWPNDLKKEKQTKLSQRDNFETTSVESIQSNVQLIMD